MEIFHPTNLFVITVCFCIIDCNKPPIDLQKIIKTKEFYQITSFISDNFTTTSDRQAILFHKFPHEIHSFGVDNQQVLYDNTFGDALKNLYSYTPAM